jgi:hypothetical protein
VENSFGVGTSRCVHMDAFVTRTSRQADAPPASKGDGAKSSKKPGRVRVGRRVYGYGGKFTDPKVPGFTPILCLTPSSPYGAISPYCLRDVQGRVMENLWQFSKVYRTVPPSRQTYSRYDARVIWQHGAEVHVAPDGTLLPAYWAWREKGFAAPDAIRYPVTFEHRTQCIGAIAPSFNLAAAPTTAAPTTAASSTAAPTTAAESSAQVAQAQGPEVLAAGPHTGSVDPHTGSVGPETGAAANETASSNAATAVRAAAPVPAPVPAPVTAPAPAPAALLDYVQSRRLIYLPVYAQLLEGNRLFEHLRARHLSGEDLLIIEVDGPHQESLAYYRQKYGVAADFIVGDTVDVNAHSMRLLLNDTKHPFGHGYCLAMALMGKAQEWNAVYNDEIL